MKIKHYIIIALVIITFGFVVSFGTWFTAEHLDEGSYLTTKTIVPDSAVRLQTTGEDLRIYEYTPETLPYLQCVFVAGTNKGDNTCVVKEEYILKADVEKYYNLKPGITLNDIPTR